MKIKYTSAILKNLLYTILTCTAPVIYADVPAVDSNTMLDNSKVTTALANIAVPFEENRGQADAKVAFQAKTLAGPLFVTKDGELVWSLTNHLHPHHSPLDMREVKTPNSNPPSPVKERGLGGEVEVKNYPPHSPLDRREVKAYSVVEKFVGGTPKPAGAVPSSTQVNYFHGNDTSKWHGGIPTWQQVSLGEVWPGIEVSVAARGNNAEKLFTVAPGADVSKIAVEVVGGELAVTKEGALKIVKIVPTLQRGNASGDAPASRSEVADRITEGMTQTNTTLERRKLHSHAGAWERSTPNSPSPSPVMEMGPGGEVNLLTFTPPIAYQFIHGERKAVQVAYQIKDLKGFKNLSGLENVYGFTLGTHDPTQPVIIDPLIQSTYLGGSNQDRINAMVVTADAVYVAGSTHSSNFPGTNGGAQASFGGCGFNACDAFIAKLSLDLKSLTQASYLGGSSEDQARSLHVSNSAVYVAGITYSSDFPATSGGAQASFGGNSYDAFVAKLSLDLKSLTQASYLGGGMFESADALTVNSSAVYVAGITYSSDFPATSGGAQASCGSCTSYSDAFVAKLSLDLKTLTQASYLGGGSYDWAEELHVSNSAVYVAGSTYSSNFPAVSGGAQASFGGGYHDAFVAKINLDLTTLTQASYLGGGRPDSADALTVSNSAVYVAGYTASSNFPATSGGAQASCGDCTDYYDAFVAKLNLDLTTLTQASYLGGSKYDHASALNVSSSGVYVAGYTSYSSNFPGTSGGAQASFGGGYQDVFLAKLSLDLKSLTQASYLGGSADDVAYALNVSSSAVYVSGDTASSNFPVTSGGVQASFAGFYDGFVAKLTPDLRAESVVSIPTVTTTAASTISVNSAQLNGTVTPNGAATTVSFDFGLTSSYGTSLTATPSSIAANATATNVSATKTGLTCNKLYHYRVKAVNSAGTSRGGDKTFTTSTCPPQPINGVCGTANGGTFNTAPTTNLCSTGTATAVTGTGPWNWNCTGSNGGTTANCSANNNVPINSWLYPVTLNIARDREFNLNVTAKSDGMYITNYEFILTFDPTKLSLIYNPQCNNFACPGANALSYNSVYLVGTNAIKIIGLGGQTIAGNDLQLLIIKFKTQTTLGVTNVELKTNSLVNTSGMNIGLGTRGATINISSGICGDANGDTTVNIIDALAIGRKLVGLPPPPTIEPLWANVNTDNNVTIIDALHIARFAIGLQLPPEVCNIGQPL